MQIFSKEIDAFPNIKRMLLYSSIGFTACALIVTYLSNDRSHLLTVGNIKTESRNITEVFKHSVTNLFGKIETNLLNLEHHLVEDRKLYTEKEHSLHLLLKNHLKNKSEISDYLLIDKSGSIIATAKYATPPKEHFISSSFFEALKNQTTQSLVIGEKIVISNSGATELPVGIPIIIGSSFEGAIIAKISPEQFEALVATLSLPSKSSLYLLRNTGHLVLRIPDISDYDGWNKANNAELRTLASAKTDVFTTRHSKTDGIEKLSFISEIPQLGLLIMMSLPKQALLASWSTNSQIKWLISGFLILIFNLILIFYYKNILKTEQTEKKKKELQNSLNYLTQTTWQVTGESYFHSISRSLLEITKADYAIISSVRDEEPNQAHTVACHTTEGSQNNFSYALKGTPCQDVVSIKDLCVFNSQVAQQFPEDKLLIDFGIEAYAGIPIFDSQTNVIGLVILLRRQAFPDIDLLRMSLAVAASRTSAEMERTKFETERLKQQEQLASSELTIFRQQKAETIGALASGIAHDLNNILTSIYGHLEIANHKIESAHPAKPNLQKIQQASERAKHLVKQILQFAKTKETFREPINVHYLIEEVFGLVRAVVPQSIEIDLNLNSPNGYISGDSSQIHQVLMNLVTNAYQAIPNAKGKITISANEVGKTKNEILISIKDTGCGIPEDKMEKIFEPFFTTKNRTEGTGLGLSVARNIIEKFDGKISVRSKVSEGTEFLLTFPRIEASAVKVTEVKPVQILNSINQKGHRKVMLVDDEKDLCDMVAEFLEIEGFSVESFSNPLEALTAFQKSPSAYHLVITDMTMPHLTGDQLLKKIRESNSQQRALVISGFNKKLDSFKNEQDGLTQFLMKPFDFTELLQVVSTSASNDYSKPAA